MKTSSLLLLLTVGFVQFSCGQNIKGIVKQIPGQLPTQLPSNQKPALSNEEVISGLKEALQVGIKNSVSKSSALDGFLGNPQIRLPFPPDALKVKEKALQLGMNNQVEQFETTLNRAAEEAVKEALPIFTQAILNMSVQDGFAILKGGNGAATNFLKNQTSQQLYNAFLPKVKEAIDESEEITLVDENEPKKRRRGRNKKEKIYFSKATEEAIVQYNEESDIAIRNHIYENKIKYSFEKLVENIFNTFKFTYFDNSPLEIQKETVSHLVSNIHKFQAGKGKAFSISV